MVVEGRSVSLSPKSMVDSVADWPLARVVEHLKKKESENGHTPPSDSRVYSRSSIRFLDTIINEVANEFGISRGRMCRCLSYHGYAILEQDQIMQELHKKYKELRRMSVEKDNPDIADIINSLAPYSPKEVDASKVSFLVYDTWMLSDLEQLSQACGVFPGQVAQVAMLRSIITCDIPEFSQVMERLEKEAKRWDTWMNFRLSVLDVAVAKWESLI